MYKYNTKTTPIHLSLNTDGLTAADAFKHAIYIVLLISSSLLEIPHTREHELRLSYLHVVPSDVHALYRIMVFYSFFYKILSFKGKAT